MLFPLKTEFYPFGKDSYEAGCKPFEPQSEIAALKHRMAALERRVDGLVALLTNPKDPEAGPTGAPALIRLPAMTEQPKSDIDLDALILAQRQHHQQSPWARH